MFHRILYAALMLATVSCATAPASMEPAFNLTGVWDGETRVTPCITIYRFSARCNAVNRITFVIRQEGSALRGDYKCAIGNMVCRDAHKTTAGDIVEGQLSGRTLAFRVMLPGDVSSCLYNGEASSTRAGGTYRCYQGGGLDEMGVWQVSRRAD